MKRKSLRRAGYATFAEFCEIFESERSQLYLLAVLLTANRGHAEQCFASSRQDCFEAASVYRECARSWSRRAIVKNAIRIVGPASCRENTTVGVEIPPESFLAGELKVITRLKPFPCFAFVMSVLEGYPDRECAALLACSQQEVARARCRAILQLHESEASGLVALCGTAASETHGPVMNRIAPKVAVEPNSNALIQEGL